MVSLKTSQIHIVLGDDKTIIRSALKEDLKVLKVLFLANWLAHNKKVTKKFVFRETWSPERRHNRSQSPVFGLAVLYPTGSEIWRFTGKETRYRKNSLLYLSVHWEDLIEQIKNILSYTLEW